MEDRLAPVLEYFNSITPLPRELVDDILKYAVIKEYEKNEMILKEGKVSNYCSWIIKGLTRSYHIRDAEDITTKFLWEGACITSVYSYYSRKPSTENIVAMEHTVLASLHYDHMKNLYKEHPVFNVIGRVITEQYLYMLELEVYNLRKQKAEDRYQFIIKHIPHLLQRVPLKHLATYLGINLETLSRIRAKARQNP